MGPAPSPYRSTVPLIALVKDEPGIFSGIVKRCGAGPEFNVHFEYKTALPGVEGNPSQTDAMVLSPKAALAVEAKWTEPRYETVAKRLEARVRSLMSRDERAGRPPAGESHRTAQLAVINAWLKLLSRHSSAALDFETANAAIYQMIHRAASACVAPGKTCSLAYLHFHAEPLTRGAASGDQYRSDLAQLHKLMGSPSAFNFYVVEVSLEPTAAFRQIEGLKKGTRETDHAVRHALLSNRLFDFGEPNFEQVA